MKEIIFLKDGQAPEIGEYEKGDIAGKNLSEETKENFVNRGIAKYKTGHVEQNKKNNDKKTR